MSWINTAWWVHRTVQLLLQGLGCASLSQRKTQWWKHMINIWQHLPSVSCTLYRLLLSTDNPVPSLRESWVWAFLKVCWDQLQYELAHSISVLISRAPTRHSSNVISHLPRVVCSLNPPSMSALLWNQRQDSQSTLCNQEYSLHEQS